MYTYRYGSTVYITQIKMPDRSSRIAAMSMYLLAVRTNVDYQVVGTILLSKYSDKPLREILALYKETNEGWIPRYFMIDMSEDLLFTVTDLFPGENNPLFVSTLKVQIIDNFDY